MDNPQIILESIKGIWAILAVFATGIVSWIGWSIKEKASRKKSEAEKEKIRDEKLNNLEAKIDKIIDYQVEVSKEQNKRLNKISAGLELCMEDDDLIFNAFRKTKILNGESESQSKKLAAYRKSLMHESLTSIDDDIDELKDE